MKPEVLSLHSLRCLREPYRQTMANGFSSFNAIKIPEEPIIQNYFIYPSGQSSTVKSKGIPNSS
jgi:hypothetical protein